MKRIFTLFSLLLLIGSYNLNAQCNPDLSIANSGLYPSEFDLPCIEVGVPYDTVIQIKNFDTVDISGAAIAILWVRVDSLAGLPNGLTYGCVTASADPTCQIQTSENACVRISGTSSDAIGQYKMGIFLTANTWPLGIFQGVTADFFGFRYDLRLVNPGQTCPNIDTTIMVGIPFGFSPYSTGVNDLDNDLQTFMIYPSPLRYENEGYVSITSLKNHKVTATIVDLAGKAVFTESYELKKGTTIRSFDASVLAPGAYFYNVSNEKGTSSVKFIKLN